MKEVTIQFKEHNGPAVIDLIDDNAEVVLLEALPVGDQYRYRYAVIGYGPPIPVPLEEELPTKVGPQLVSLPSAVERDGERSAASRARSFDPSERAPRFWNPDDSGHVA